MRLSLHRWGWLLLALLATAATARLGLWQLDRAAQKLALQAELEHQTARAPLGNDDLAEAQPHRRVRLQGRWVAERTVWLDNRPMDGRAGFIAVTPLRLQGRPELVLVQRGWAPRDVRDRTRLPPLPSPDALVEVVGRLETSPSRAFELGAGEAGVIRQNLDPAGYALETGLALSRWTVVQTEPPVPDDGLARHWPAPDLGLQKHYGYAFQWFALSALIVALYVWFQLLRPRRRRPA